MFPFKKTTVPDPDLEIYKGFVALSKKDDEFCRKMTIEMNSFDRRIFIKTRNVIPNMPQKCIIFARLPDTYEITVVTDMIENTELCRLKTVINGVSIYDHYMNNARFRAEITRSAALRQTDDEYMKRHKLREAIWQSGIKEATQFATISFYLIIRYFEKQLGRSISVVDGCAGWGDRLFAACAAKVPYFGVDVNQEMKPSYDYIISRFGNGKQIVDLSGLENAALPAADLAFISPPFFNKEEYVPGNKLQSTTRRNYREWMNNWLLPCIGRLIDCLHPNSYLIVYYADYDAKKTVEEIIQYVVKRGLKFDSIGGTALIDSLDVMTNHGQIKIAPMWIFKF